MGSHGGGLVRGVQEDSLCIIILMWFSIADPFFHMDGVIVPEADAAMEFDSLGSTCSGMFLGSLFLS